jgi:hypothetical protein
MKKPNPVKQKPVSAAKIADLKIRTSIRGGRVPYEEQRK